MERFLEEFIAGLENLRTLDEFKAHLVSAIADLGFEKFTYAGVKPNPSRRGSPVELSHGVIALSDLRQDWVEHYTRQAYYDSDPIIRACSDTSIPVIWTESFARDSCTPHEVEMMADAHDHGLQFGITIPIHAPRGEMGVLSVTGSGPESEFRRLIKARGHQLHLAAIHYHEALNRTLRRELPSPVEISKREIECLLWTADGKSAWEIGGILNITERTVNAHLSNAMRKLGVFTKTHAVAKFITGAV